MLTFEQIKELLELVAERKLEGFELERSGFRLKIDGQGGTAVPVAAAPAALAPAAVAPVALAPDAVPAAPASAAAPAPPAEEEASELPAGAHVVHSPIVGTFYRSPNPDAPSFAEVGDRVSRGQILCIVEAMKLMNEIESDVDGVVLEVYPQNAQPVEFGEPLFAIKPS